MTRINTNVSSLNAQLSLAKSNSELQTALTRLSTGLRINTGKDDPAGLIASEILGSDITSTSQAVTNSESANQMIATADSALGQVSSLLNDIRGLIEAAANTGAMSSSQIAANQLQVDSSLEAIDRIAQITQFQGERLLDGNLDFLTTGVNSSQVTNAEIQKANFGTLSAVPVSIQLAAQATKAQLSFNASSTTAQTVVEIGGKNGYQAFTFAANSTVDEMASAINLVSDATGVAAVAAASTATANTAGSSTLTSVGADNDIVLTAKTAGNEAGNINVKYELDTTSNATSVSYTAATGKTAATAGTLTVKLGTTQWAGAAHNYGATGNSANAMVVAKFHGSDFDGVTVDWVNNATIGAPTVAYDATAKKLTITVDATNDTYAQVATAFTSNARVNGLFSFSCGDAAANTVAVADTLDTTLSGGVTGGSIVAANATANAVIDAIKADANANAALSATLASGNTGAGQVSVFENYLDTGTVGDNNALQFLGPQNARDLSVQFVAGGANQTLSVDLLSSPPVYGQSTVSVQQTNANAGFTLTAVNSGTAYDGVKVIIQDTVSASGTDNSVAYNAEAKTVTIRANITGAGTKATAADVINLVNNDDYVNKYFNASLPGGAGTGTGLLNAVASGVATTSGGLVSKGKLTVNLATDSTGTVTTTANDLVNYFTSSNAPASLAATGITVSSLGASTGTGKLTATADDLSFTSAGRAYTPSYASGKTFARGGTTSQLTVQSLATGDAFDGAKVVFADTATAGDETFSYDSTSKTLTVGIDSGTTTAADVVTAWKALAASNEVRQKFNFAATDGTGAGSVYASDSATLTGGAGSNGVSQGVNLYGHYDIGDTTGAAVLQLQSVEYGSAAFVSAKALSGSFAVTDRTGASSTRTAGTDIDARVNGVKAVADGLAGSISTFALDFKFSLSENMIAGQNTSFTITGGGAQFQLGPDVVSNQQVRLGITSVNTAKLGGVSGRMYELRSGGAKSLTGDVSGAAAVTEDAITQVTTLRGRLGALQKTTIDTNINSLNDTLEALTQAKSTIQDTDFASESANMTRAQILVQSGTAVLKIANQRPQNVLSLLQG
jgi:flagellin-like hook-associated protein FlgL